MLYDREGEMFLSADETRTYIKRVFEFYAWKQAFDEDPHEEYAENLLEGIAEILEIPMVIRVGLPEYQGIRLNDVCLNKLEKDVKKYLKTFEGATSSALLPRA